MPSGGHNKKTLTKAQANKLEKLAATLSQDQMADYFGIARETFRKMMKREPDLGRRYKRGKASAITGVADGLLQKALDGHTASQMFYLKTQAGWRETDKPEDGDAPAVTIIFNATEAKGEIDVTEPDT